MNGLIRKAGLFTLGALFLAGVAAAGVPTAANSTIPDIIKLGAQDTGPGPEPNGANESIEAIDPAVSATFTIRDANNILVANVAVTIDFSGCTTGEFRLCGTQPGAGMTIDCTARTITGTTNGSGQVTFRVVGSTVVSGGPTNTQCAVVTSLGQTLKLMRVAAYDDNAPADGNGDFGIQASDVNRIATDRKLRLVDFPLAPLFDASHFRARSDFDGDGQTGANDVNEMATKRAAVLNNVAGAFDGSCAGGVTCP